MVRGRGRVHELTVEIVDEDLDATSPTADVTDQVDSNVADGTCFAFFATIGTWETRELDAVRIGHQLIPPDDDVLPSHNSCQ